MEELMKHLGSAVATLTLIVGGCGAPADLPEQESTLKIADDIVERRAQFVPQTITTGVEHLSEGDQRALEHLVTAADAMGEIFFVQAWAGNPEFAPKVAALAGPDADAAREYYRIMVGPWDRRDHHVPFIGDRPHPPGAGYYPADPGR